MLMTSVVTLKIISFHVHRRQIKRNNKFLCLDQLPGKMVDKVQRRRTVMRIKTSISYIKSLSLSKGQLKPNRTNTESSMGF